MATVVLDSQSHAYLQSLGLDSPTDTNGVYETAQSAALNQLNSALTLGASIDPAAVEYLDDYYNDDPSNITYLKSWLYSTVSPGANQGNNSSRLAYYLNTLKGPITDALAPLLADPTFTYNEAERNGTLVTGLNNGQQSNYPPPAAAIAALGTSSANITTIANNTRTTTTSSLSANRAKAQGYAESYFNYAASNQLPIDQDLIDAYVSLDPAHAATFIGTTLQSTIASNGNCQPDLMATYLKLNPSGPGGPSSTSPSPFAALNTAFDGTQPTITGRAWLALNSLTSAVNAGKPLDPAMLSNLDSVNPWAGAYVRWEALKQQAPSGTLNADYLTALNGSNPAAAAGVCKTVLSAEIAAHQNLNPDYLNIVAASDKVAAAALCNQELQDALQATNALLGASGLVNPYNAANTTTPTFRIDLNGMGTTAPVANDVVTLYSDGKPVGSATLQADDISRGYVDITSSSLTTDNHSITSQFTHAATNYTSPQSTPLQVVIDTTAPTLQNSGNYAAFDSEWNGQDIVLKFNVGNASANAGLAPITPAPGDFVVTASWTGSSATHPTVTNVTVDAANHVRLTLSPNPNGAAGVSVTYTPGASPLQDTAGNTVAGFTSGAIPWHYASEVASLLSTPTAAAPPQPRTMDMNAWNVLNSINPVLAGQWSNQFKASGLLPPPAPPPGSTSTAGSASAADVEALLWSAYTNRMQIAENELTQQITVVQQNNDTMSKLNDLLGLMNKMDAELPSDATATTKLNTLSDFASQQTQINNAIKTAGVKPFSSTNTSGVIDSNTTKGQLDGAIQQLKSQIDSLGNNQQTEMLRLQELTTQRDQDAQIPSDALKAFSDLRDKIITNM
jgi:hypothetical protein